MKDKLLEIIKNLPWDKILKAVKTAGRNLVLAVLPILAAHFQVLDAQWAGVAYFALVGLDKFLHEHWEGTNKKGLIPF